MKKTFINIFLAMAAVTMIALGYLQFSNGQQVRALPYFEPIATNSGQQTDSLHRHLVTDFSLTDQSGKTITRKDFENSITAVDFFFTSCRGICPVMNSQMKRVYEKFKGNSEVQIISHTVNPENDSVPVLAEYAKRYNADANQWHFVTGDKAQLYNLARQSYMISDTKGNGGKEDFVHSQNFALVDKEGHIRGIYNGVDSSEVNRMMVEMDVLLGSYKR
jgi:protein SCO1/2